MSVTTTAPSARVRYPGRRAADLRIAVTIEEPSTPFPIVVYFVHVTDGETPERHALIPVGIELGQRFDRPVDDDGQPRKRHDIGERLPRPLDRDVVQEVTARLAEYIEFARGCVAVGRTPSASRETPGSRPRRRRRREQSPEFLQGIAEQFLTWSDGGDPSPRSPKHTASIGQRRADGCRPLAMAATCDSLRRSIWALGTRSEVR